MIVGPMTFQVMTVRDSAALPGWSGFRAFPFLLKDSKEEIPVFAFI